MFTDEEEEWWINEIFGNISLTSSVSSNQRPHQDNEIDFIEDLIKGGIFDDILNEDIFLSDSKRRRCGRTKKINYYTDTLWGRNLLHPDMKVAKSKIARDFRRKFRVPFPVFDKIIVPECDRLNVFEVTDTARVRIPTDFKVMICLRILGKLKYCRHEINNIAVQP